MVDVVRMVKGFRAGSSDVRFWRRVWCFNFGGLRSQSFKRDEKLQLLMFWSCVV